MIDAGKIGVARERQRERERERDSTGTVINGASDYSITGIS